MKFKTKVQTIVNAEQFALLEQYVNLIEQYNQVMNLTGFTDDVLWEEGIYESIISLNLKLKNQKGTLLDIGAGVGFPSIPFLITNPNIKLTIYESQQKRVKFLKVVKDKLKLDFTIKNIRVEESKELNKFNFITARAVASLNILIQASYHLAHSDCWFIFIKGPRYKEEILQANHVIKKLSLDLTSIKVNQIHSKDIYIVAFKKAKLTPSNWPLKWKVIKDS